MTRVSVGVRWVSGIYRAGGGVEAAFGRICHELATDWSWIRVFVWKEGMSAEGGPSDEGTDNETRLLIWLLRLFSCWICSFDYR